MSPVPKQENTEAPEVVGRRSARLSMIIPITVQGIDTSGQPFKENTWTIGVNKQGARIATFHPLAVGTPVSIVNPVLGRAAKARVIWVGEKRFTEDPYEVGVELIEAQNVWGIKFPPEDWQRAGLVGTGGRAQEREKSPEPPPAAEKPSPPSAAKAPESAAAAAPTPPPTEAGTQLEKFSEFNLAVAGLSRFAEQSEAQAPTAPEPDGPRAPAQTAESRTPAPAEESEKPGEVAAPGEKVTPPLEGELTALVERAQASREQLESLLSRIEGLQKSLEAELEKAQSAIRDASTEALAIPAKELEERVRQESAKLADGAVGELALKLTESLSSQAETAYKTVEASFQEKLEKIRQQIQEVISNTAQQARQSYEQEAEAGKKIIEDRVNWAVDSINVAAGAAATQLYTAYQKFEADFKSKVEDYPKRLEEHSNTVTEAFQQKTRALLDEMEAALKNAWREFQEKGGKEVSEKLQKTSDRLLELSAKELQKQGAEVVDLFSEQLKASGVRFLDDTQKQLNAAAQSTRQALAGEARSAEHTVKSLTEEFRRAGKAALSESEAGFKTLTRVTLESLTKEALAMATEYKSQSQKTVRELQEKALRELQSRLQPAIEAQIAALPARLQRELEDATERAVREIRGKAAQVVEEASDTVYKQVGVGAGVLRDWASQARTHLETVFQRSVEAFQSQIADISRATIEKHHRESEISADQLRSRLQEAARILHAAVGDATETKAPQPAEIPAESSPPTQVQPRESLDVFVEKLKAKQHQALKDAAENFRKQLSDILGGIQPAHQEDPKRDR